MGIHIKKNSIRATGSDANALLIAMASDDYLLKAQQNKTGNEEFQRMVIEAIDARGLKPLEGK